VTRDLPDFVEQSNAIEGYVPSGFGRSSGHPIYVRHLAVAERIAGGEILAPTTIHAALFDGLLAPGLIAGEFRSGSSAVGGASMPGHADIEARMRVWNVEVDAGPDGDAAAWAWEMHHRFVCHHPFLDGNGRVARLLLNQLRLAAGLPWLTVRAEDADVYADEIRAWRGAVCRGVTNASA
jgi:fido (protein-threonine AMPylation protein)